MEELMVKAIRQFKKEHRIGEIRTCYATDWRGNKGGVTEAVFLIEYVECSGGEYKHVNILVNKGKK